MIPINSNVDVIQFVGDVKCYEDIELYVQHLIDTLVIVEKDNKEKGQNVEEEIFVDVD